MYYLNLLLSSGSSLAAIMRIYCADLDLVTLLSWVETYLKHIIWTFIWADKTWHINRKHCVKFESVNLIIFIMNWHSVEINILVEILFELYKKLCCHHFFCVLMIYCFLIMNPKLFFCLSFNCYHLSLSIINNN